MMEGVLAAVQAFVEVLWQTAIELQKSERGAGAIRLELRVGSRVLEQQIVQYHPATFT